jgi:hypothetical protein
MIVQPVVDHKWSLNFITHETFRLEQNLTCLHLLHQPFCRKSHMRVDQVTIKLDSAITYCPSGEDFLSLSVQPKKGGSAGLMLGGPQRLNSCCASFLF